MVLVAIDHTETVQPEGQLILFAAHVLPTDVNTEEMTAVVVVLVEVPTPEQ